VQQPCSNANRTRVQMASVERLKNIVRCSVAAQAVLPVRQMTVLESGSVGLAATQERLSKNFSLCLSH
jgi:hypothetical protein